MGDVKEVGDIIATALSFNYTMAQAKGLVATYESIIGASGSKQRERYLSAINCINLAKLISIDDLRECGISVETSDKATLVSVLWELGIDTNYGFTFDVGCFNTNGKVRCGMYLVGQERTDEEWVTLVVDGNSVASLEAIFRSANDPSLEMELNMLAGS